MFACNASFLSPSGLFFRDEMAVSNLSLAAPFLRLPSLVPGHSSKPSLAVKSVRLRPCWSELRVHANAPSIVPSDRLSLARSLLASAVRLTITCAFDLAAAGSQEIRAFENVDPAMPLLQIRPRPSPTASRRPHRRRTRSDSGAWRRREAIRRRSFDFRRSCSSSSLNKLSPNQCRLPFYCEHAHASLGSRESSLRSTRVRGQVGTIRQAGPTHEYATRPAHARERRHDEARLRARRQ